MPQYTYNIRARRFIRQHTDTEATPAATTASQAASAFEALRTTASWREIFADINPSLPATGSEQTDGNLNALDSFDAFAFCANHTDDRHRLYLGAACYVFRLPDKVAGTTATPTTLRQFAANMFGDHFLPDGARLVLRTSPTGLPTNDWAEITAGDVMVQEGVKRTERPDPAACPTCVRWFATSATQILNQDETKEDGTELIFPSAGLTLDKYLLVYLTLENYLHVRNAWVEGAARIDRTMQITVETTAADLPPSGDLPEGGLVEGRVLILSGTDYIFPLREAFDTDKYTTEMLASSAPTARGTYPRAYNGDAVELLLRYHGLRYSDNHYSFSLIAGASNIVNNAPVGIIAIAQNQTATPAINQYTTSYVHAIIPANRVFNKIVLKNGSTAVTVSNGATVTLTPWFLQSGKQTQRSLIGEMFESGTVFDPAFWSGQANSARILTRIGLPMPLPSAIAIGTEIEIPVSAPTSGGFLVIAAHIANLDKTLIDVPGNATYNIGLIAAAPPVSLVVTSTPDDKDRATTASPVPSGWKPDIYIA